MKPKKTKELISELAKNLQLSEEEIKSVLDLYWRKVRKTLSSLEHTHVNLKGLGTMYMKPWIVEKRIKMNDCAMENYIESPTNGSLTILNNLAKDNLKLKAAKEELDKQSIKKKLIKNERHNQNLEGEEQDS